MVFLNLSYICTYYVSQSSSVLGSVEDFSVTFLLPIGEFQFGTIDFALPQTMNLRFLRLLLRNITLLNG